MSKERHYSASKDMRNENIETNPSVKNNRHSLPGIFQSSRDCLCSENESNSVETSSVASSEVVKEEINQESEQSVSNVRPSRTMRPNRPLGIDSYLTSDGGFKRRSRRDVSYVNKKIIITSIFIIFIRAYWTHLAPNV